MITTDSQLPVAVTMIAAMTRDGGLGADGDLLFHISADLRRFKALTLGRPVIMGRRTYESLPGGPLPGRLNIVLTRSTLTLPAGAVTASTPAEALRLAADWASQHPAPITPATTDVAGSSVAKAEALPSAPTVDATGCSVPSAHPPTAMIIGGGEIYRLFLPLASRLELTIIDAPAPPSTDTWFPAIDPADWHTLVVDPPLDLPPSIDPRTSTPYRFHTLARQ